MQIYFYILNNEAQLAELNDEDRKERICLNLGWNGQIKVSVSFFISTRVDTMMKKNKNVTKTCYKDRNVCMKKIILLVFAFEKLVVKLEQY